MAPATAAPAGHRLATKREGAAAADWVRTKVGDAYVFDTAGPKTWDCSGLSMEAWDEAAGVELPHNAAEQALVTLRLKPNKLRYRRGDLVFYYTPIHHVGIYVGRDKLGRRLVVQAGDPALGVQLIRATAYATPVCWGRVVVPLEESK